MAGVFYSRYIPPAQDSPPTHPDGEKTGRRNKRKRAETEPEANLRPVNVSSQSQNKPKRSNSSQERAQRSDQKLRPQESKSDRSLAFDQQRPIKTTEPFSKYASALGKGTTSDRDRHEQPDVPQKSKVPTRHGNTDKKRGHQNPSLESNEDTTKMVLDGLLDEEPLSHSNLSPPKHQRKGKRKQEHHTSESENADSGPALSKHEKIRSKYKTSKEARANMEILAQPDESIEPNPSLPVEVHGLEPLPQPPISESTERPTFSALPAWLANPVGISESQPRSLNELGVNTKLLSNLHSSGLTNALPVQESIIPLLLQGERHYSGDLCVSAPTGSGKTLAYALPMISALMNKVITRLRGVIVVPTRELVAQVFKVCEMCASSLNLHIAMATGSKPLKEERALLVLKAMRLDPDAYRQIYTKPFTAADWEFFGLEDLFEDLDTVEDERPDYVPHYKSKVDLLISTPGRLVDHIRFTKGFTLEDVEMFVVDEADKLLDDTFQEWVDVVLPALKDQGMISVADQAVNEAGLDPPPRTVQKVILSATMTEDITKLNSLELRNPKLIAVGDSVKDTGILDPGAEAEAQGHGSFNMPRTLSESAVAVGDGMKKPLFLLHILKHDIKLDSSSYIADGRKVSERKAEYTSSSSKSTFSEDDSSISDTSSSSEASARSSSAEPSSLPNETYQPILSSVLIFTRSSEAAMRLRRLLILLEPQYDKCIATVTRSSNSASSRNAINLFRQKKVSILIATDRASRGLDLPDLGHVISYDMPPSVTAYVHRVGRTARAGKKGQAWTLVAHREGRWFWKEIGKGDQIRRTQGVRKINAQLTDDRELENKYEQGLRQLEEEVHSQEKRQ